MGRKQAVEPPPWEGSRQWNYHHGKEAGSGIITMGRKQAMEPPPWEGSRQWNHHHVCINSTAKRRHSGSVLSTVEPLRHRGVAEISGRESIG
jgi:hypothetical protein